MAASSKSFQSLKVVGANGQISLGKKFAGRPVLVEEREPGVWLIKTATVIPDDQKWFWEPEHLKKFNAAIAWAQANPPDDSTTDAILKKLHDSL
jgi:hypothetical protein